MRKIIIIGFMLFLPLTVMAQEIAWQWMDGPYFVYNVTGISIGYTDYGGQGQQTHAYAIGSDFEHEFIYSYHGDSPIGEWQRYPDYIDGIKYVSASRYNGQNAYAAVPYGGDGTPGVLYYNNQTGNWQPTVDQPDNLHIVGVEAHPTNGAICFTGASHLDNVRSVWRTTDQGVNWTAPAVPLNDTYRGVNSVRVDLNSGNGIANTIIYACFDEEGIWKNTQGGNNGYWTQLSLPGYGTSYSGIDIAAIGDNIYAISRVADVEDFLYELWHSTNGGTSWELTPIYGPDPMFRVMFFQSGGQDAVWAVSENSIYIHLIGEYPGWTSRQPDNLPIRTADIDQAGPSQGGQLYIGTGSLIERCLYEVGGGDIQFHEEEVTAGTNILNAVSLDYIEGYPMRAIGNQGGFICENLHILWPFNQYGQEWGTKDYLFRYDPADPQSVEGGKIGVYSAGVPFNFVAAGIEDENDALAIMGGHRVIEDANENPISIGALIGPNQLAAGTNFNGDDKVWIISDMYWPDLNLGNTSFSFKDLEYEWCAEQFGNYYFCGDRGVGSHLCGFAYGYPRAVAWLDGGLSAVSRANCIQKSNEQHPNTFPESEPALYLGTDRGVYKYKYDFSGTSNWYPVNSGIGTNYEIHDLANYYQIIRSNDYKPDSLVQYALAKDGGGNPYIYISADSGRSWIEFGSYFRDRNIQVNDLVTFSDWRPTADFPLWLAAGTDNGVYRFPFNVKSGTIADNETWGPGTIIVNGDVTVPDGVTLTIEPGTSILILYDFDKLESGISASLSEIIVQGTLLAQGTSSDSIFLMASSVQLGSPQPGDWKGIYIDTTADCTLEYCSISFAENGLESRNNSEVQIEHCNFHDNEFDGVYCYKSYTDIQHSRFGNNGVAESR